MVPVGGSILYSPHKPAKSGSETTILQQINQFYPGRASSSPIIDLFVTFLEMGSATYQNLLKQRKSNFTYLLEKLTILMPKYGERVLNTAKYNKISIACTLTGLNEKVFKPNAVSATFFGSYLFHRRVSGVRVCAHDADGVRKSISGAEFQNYGSHCNNYPDLPYFTTAATIGQTREEIDIYLSRLEEALIHFTSGNPFSINKSAQKVKN